MLAGASEGNGCLDLNAYVSSRYIEASADKVPTAPSRISASMRMRRMHLCHSCDQCYTLIKHDSSCRYIPNTIVFFQRFSLIQPHT